MEQRKEMSTKQAILKEIQTLQPTYRIDVGKLIIMPISGLLKKKHQLLLNDL